jgi:signal transduction histidine kinase
MDVTGRVRVASSRRTHCMRAAVPGWPLGGGTIEDVSTTFPSGRLRGDELLRAVAEGTAGAVGDEFLRCLARHVAEAFAAKLVLIAEASDPSGMHVRVLAAWYDGAFIEEPFEYDTAGQPCAVVTDYPWVSFPEALTERFPEDRSAIEMGLQSYLAVCLRSSDGVHLGHLAVLDTRPMEAGEEDAAALRIFAARASAELERRNQARALEESRARVIDAADRERRRVGRDLHDGAQQRLLAVSNLLRVSRMKLDGSSGAAAELIERAEEELSQAHAELRKLARGLHPVALTERGLGSALESLADASEVPVDIEVTERVLPLPVARAAYFIASESLANCARYASASRIDVRVRDEGRSLAVEVADDGVGGADPTCGTGLLGLVDRVEVLGGRLEVHSPPGEGTRVRATIPL